MRFISPFTQILQFLQPYLLSLPALIFHYEFWEVVEHRVLASGQWSKVREQSPGMDVSRCAAHQPVGLLYHGSHIQVVTMMKKVLLKKETGKKKRWEGRVYWLTGRFCFVQRRGLEKSMSGRYLKVQFLGAQQQRLTAAGDVGHTGHDQEWRMIGENVVKESEPLITSQNLREQGLQQRPRIKLTQRSTINSVNLNRTDTYGHPSNYSSVWSCKEQLPVKWCHSPLSAAAAPCHDGPERSLPCSGC